MVAHTEDCNYFSVKENGSVSTYLEIVHPTASNLLCCYLVQTEVEGNKQKDM